jgi:hypothetical protein
LGKLLRVEVVIVKSSRGKWSLANGSSGCF